MSKKSFLESIDCNIYLDKLSISSIVNRFNDNERCILYKIKNSGIGEEKQDFLENKLASMAVSFNEIKNFFKEMEDDKNI